MRSARQRPEWQRAPAITWHKRSHLTAIVLLAVGWGGNAVFCGMLNKPEPLCFAEKDLCSGKPADGMVALPNGTLAVFRGRPAPAPLLPCRPHRPRPGPEATPEPGGFPPLCAAHPRAGAREGRRDDRRFQSLPPCLLLSACPSVGPHAFHRVSSRRAGHYYWLLNGRSRPTTSPRRISDGWGIPSPIDAVFSRCNCDGKTFFIKVGSERGGRRPRRCEGQLSWREGAGFERRPRRRGALRCSGAVWRIL